MSKGPLLVTGGHRSGTTWAARVLMLAGNMEYIHEPLNLELRGTWGPRVTQPWYKALSPEDARWTPVDEAVAMRFPLRAALRTASGWREVVRSARETTRAGRGRLLKRRALIKDPFLTLSVDSFLGRYRESQAVVLIRHPGAFFASVKAQGWDIKPEQIFDRSELEGIGAPPYDVRSFFESNDPAVRSAALWKILYRPWLVGSPSDGQRVQVVRHETLARNPAGEFERLARRLGLSWDGASGNAFALLTEGESLGLTGGETMDVRRTSTLMADRWRQLISEADLASIQRLCGDELEQLSSAAWIH